MASDSPVVGDRSGLAQAETALEVEWKFSVPKEVDLPDFGVLGSLGATRYHDLNALYFDTPNLDLTSAGSSLRRRSGGADAGWHLKVKDPSPHARKEITAPIEGARPPQSLRGALPEDLRGTALLPWARLRSSRAETPLLDEHGRELAVICVDEVLATGSDGEEALSLLPEAHRWREVEVELSAEIAPDEVNLQQIISLLQASGMKPSKFDSKIHQGLSMLGLGPLQEDAALTKTAHLVGDIQTLEELVALGDVAAIQKSERAVKSLHLLLTTLSNRLSQPFYDHALQELEWYLGVLERSLKEGDETSSAHLSPRFEMLNDLLVQLLWTLGGPPVDQA